MNTKLRAACDGWQGYNLKLADAVYPCCLYFLYCLIVASEASCSSKLERKVMGAKVIAPSII